MLDFGAQVDHDGRQRPAAGASGREVESCAFMLCLFYIPLIESQS